MFYSRSSSIRFGRRSYGGWRWGGVCLIRLKQERPRFVPKFMGISSENAAHRFAVQWEFEGRTHEGVYIPRRDTSSRLNWLAGGKIFPGVHHHASFKVDEKDDQFHVALKSDDGEMEFSVHCEIAKDLSARSVFADLEEASDFFKEGALGYSASGCAG